MSFSKSHLFLVNFQRFVRINSNDDVTHVRLQKNKQASSLNKHYDSDIKWLEFRSRRCVRATSLT